MFDEGLLAVFKYAFLCGVAGSVIGAVLNRFTSQEKLRIDYALAVGFLVGGAIGTVVGIFSNMTTM